MKQLSIIRLLAIITGGVCALMIPALITAFVINDSAMVWAFIIPIVSGLVIATLAGFLIPKTTFGNLTPRDGFFLVILTWIFASLIGSVPYHFSPVDISFSDAIFESSCSFATTGATIFHDIESLSKSILLWRSTSHWAGGIGIILLTVALMPILGVGGFQLIKAEVPGPEKEKLRPKVTDAAKIVLGVYCVFTVVLLFLYRIGGMDWFDAVCHSFTLVSTGGVSTKNNGFAFYDSALIDWVTIIFMLLGALNFNLYFRLLKGKYKDFLLNTEMRVFFLIFIVCAFFSAINLIPKYGSFAEALRFGSFQVASFLSTSGNVRSDYTTWPILVQSILFCLMFIGGCSGSTAGGVKVIRHTVLLKQALNEIQRILYPKGVFSIQLNKKVGRKDVVYGVAGFFFIYFVIILITTFVTAASGYDVFTSFNVAVSITGNIGTGFSSTGSFNNYSSFPEHLKIFYSIVMIAGRLELWAVVVLFTPVFWKR